MKKYISALAVLFTLALSSCTNDDLAIKQSVTFKINPATVVENLYEINTGDLKTTSKGSSINICLYIYDESGQLVASDKQKVNAYTQVVTSNLTLGIDTYKVIAISYVSSSDVSFWKISGEKELSTLKITDEGYIGGRSKILGVTAKNVSINGNNNNINIDINNAGAVSGVFIVNWNRFTDAKNYGLAGKQSSDYAYFEANGDIDYSVETKSNYGYYKALLAYDPSTEYAYTYFFSFPIKDAALRFFAESTSGEQIYFGANFVDDIKLGDSYVFYFDVETEETKWFDETPNKVKQSRVGNFSKNIEGAEVSITYDYTNNSISFK